MIKRRSLILNASGSSQRFSDVGSKKGDVSSTFKENLADQIL